MTPLRSLFAALFPLWLGFAVAQDDWSKDGAHLPLRPGMAEYWDTVLPVVGDKGISASGDWREEEFRRCFPARRHWFTEEEGATLERVFEGAGLSLVLEGHLPYVYRGMPNLGLLEVWIDGELSRTLDLATEAAEVVLYRRDVPGRRTVRLRHRHAPGGGKGVRIVGFREWSEPSADLLFSLGGEASDLLMDARLTVRQGRRVVRTAVQRNRLSGMIRLADLPPGEGCTLEVEALGWEPLSIPLPPLHAGSERILVPLNLRLDADLLTVGIERPRLGHPAVKGPGERLRLELAAPASSEPGVLTAVRWIQSIGEARRSVLLWQGEEPVPEAGGAVEIDLPSQPLDGLGDLVLEVRTAGGPVLRRAPRSLRLRPEYPEQPVFLALGHLDTWGQYQGEYLAAFAEMANLIDPDAVLFSNEVHPAYVAGGLKRLQTPHLTTIGNHAFGYREDASLSDAEGNPLAAALAVPSVSVGAVEQGHVHREPHHDGRHAVSRRFDRWYGDPLGVVELGPDIAVLNYGWSWDPSHNRAAIEEAAARFEPFRGRRIRILNAYEGDAPEDLLERFGFALVHSAHAWPEAADRHAPDPGTARRQHRFVSKDGGTHFIGKRSSDTFRVVRFADDRVASLSYAGHEFLPSPFDRHRVAPLRVEFSDPEGSEHRARLVNDYREAFPACRVDWVLPKGRYAVSGAALRGQWDSDDGRWTVLHLRADAAANSVLELRATAP